LQDNATPAPLPRFTTITEKLTPRTIQLCCTTLQSRSSSAMPPAWECGSSSHGSHVFRRPVLRLPGLPPLVFRRLRCRQQIHRRYARRHQYCGPHLQQFDRRTSRVGRANGASNSADSHARDHHASRPGLPRYQRRWSTKTSSKSITSRVLRSVSIMSLIPGTSR
jgi:hypothetical protein